MNFWELSPKQVEDLQGSDGGPFRDFVNRLIRAQASKCGIPASAISTDSRNARDGGVDCSVSQAASADPSGRLCEKTCWQFKAVEHNKITENQLRQEVRKPYSSELLRNGYAYRFCIADSLTAEKKACWEAVMADEIKELSPAAPAPQVLTSTCLANWASHFPAIVAGYVRLEGFFDLEAWGRQISGPTPSYVAVDVWAQIASQIGEHVDFTRPARSLLFPVHADAGVGKTRLVYETLRAIPESPGLVIYTRDDEVAQNLALHLARWPDKSAVLVIDECSLEGRHRVQQVLGNHQNVRIITIANYARSTASPEPSLRRMFNETVEKILVENFPHVPEERRRAAVSLAGGFVKIAADVCQHDLAGGLVPVEGYYRLRVWPAA